MLGHLLKGKQSNQCNKFPKLIGVQTWGFGTDHKLDQFKLVIRSLNSPNFFFMLLILKLMIENDIYSFLFIFNETFNSFGVKEELFLKFSKSFHQDLDHC